MLGNKGWCGNERAEGLEVKTPIEEGVPGLVRAQGVLVVAYGTHQFQSCQIR